MKKSFAALFCLLFGILISASTIAFAEEKVWSGDVTLGLKENVFIGGNNNGILDKGESWANGISFILGEDNASANKSGIFLFSSC